MRFISFVSFAFVAAVSASNVVELDPSNFDSIIGKGKPALVELYVHTRWTAALVLMLN